MPKRGPLLLLLLVPILIVGPSLLRGRLFLPQVPAALAPFREENPARAARALRGQSYPESDRLYPVLTDQTAMREQLSAGSLPRWEPKLGLGVPLFAESIAGAAYPPNWLALLVPPERAAGVLALLSVFLAGLGAWLFLGRIGLSAPAVLVGALAYQFGGWGLGNLFYPMKFDAGLWLPFALWSIEGIRLGRRWSGIGLTVSLAACLLAGMPGVGILVAALAGVYALARLSPLAPLTSVQQESPSTSVSRSSRQLRRGPPLPPYLTAALFALLGLGSAALWLLPLAEVSRQSSRQEAPIAVLESQALPTSTLLGTVVHDLFGSPLESTPPGNLPIAWWLTPASRSESALGANQLEWNTFCGGVVLALSLVGLLASFRRAALPGFLLLAVLGFTCNWPIFGWGYHLPGLNVGSPTRALALAWFLWPWLAAIGADALGRNLRRARGVLVAVGALLAIFAFGLFARTDPASFPGRLDEALVARYDSLQSPSDVRKRFSLAESRHAAERVRHSAGLLAGVSLALLAGGLLALRRKGPRPWMTGGALLTILLVEGGIATGQHFSGRPHGGPVHPRSKAIEAIRKAAAGGRVLRFAPGRNGRGDVLELARPNMLEPYGIADLTPWIVFPPRTYNELFAAFDPASRDSQGVSRLSNARLIDHPILDLVRASCILSRLPLDDPRLSEVLGRPGFHVYHRSGALGPARIVPHAIPSASESAVLSVLAAGAVDWSRETLLAPGEAAFGGDRVPRPSSTGAGAETNPGSEPGPIGRSSAAGRIVSFERLAADHIRITLEDVRGGWLVLHEQFYPGWEATIDGRPVPIRRADHVYQALPLSTGERVVEFRYRPRSLRIGALLSLASLLAALFLSRRLGA